MRKTFVAVLVLAFCCSPMLFGQKKASAKSAPAKKAAVEKTVVVPIDEKESSPAPETPPNSMKHWSLFQIGFLPKFPSYTKTSNVYGLKLGAPMCSGYGRVFGVEPSILYSGTRYVKGVQASFWGTCIARRIYGVQASSFGPSITGTLWGIQADGTLAMAEELTGIQTAPVTMAMDLTGIQFGAVNLSQSITGFQGGAVNLSKKTKGVQLGIFNYSEKNGCQFGAVNIIRNSWIPFTIVFNIYFKKEK
ncbi:MAG: hypothetical protein GXP32_04790 [Kiritimatiellaeota bacterium]|nr:hypothetical protein [Kiritimatiellota bacterium]